jgi:hypothetical protein
VPGGLCIAVDVRSLADPPAGLQRPVPDIAEDLAAWGVPTLPVLHPAGSGRRLADLGSAAALHGRGAVVRLELQELDLDKKLPGSSMRWARRSGGNSGFFDLCASLVTADHWPAEGGGYSWGDAQLAKRAAGEGGPGNPESWIKWGMSHHLAEVVDRLS